MGMLDLTRRAKLFKPFADERGQRLMQILWKGERCTHELSDETDMPQSSVSYHMNILCESGLVERRRDGKWTHYRIGVKGVEVFKNELEALALECEKFLKMMN